ncbi:hypothetical protein [Rhodospirillum centenum]|uniref:Uncharacterized protein n=1 Tax=Rhodospirillum centenum (strain ATCC 51521 / SW) TaxID=414684 RepID=B6IYS9_RHOCS|nr:hypothetical protein [Rhodospirillum centenum]ACJ01453.1 conserved hypothetical protein [Rhodospirillum centenum SW]
MHDTAAIDHYRRLAQDTTIDGTTLLSTDYFNHFNEVIMLLSMLGDMPDMLEEVKAWRPKTYAEHFRGSGLHFAPLAIECYENAPPEYRDPFDLTIDELNATIADALTELDASKDDPARMGDVAVDYWQRLQALVDRGSAIVHGSMPQATLDQSAIDDLF